MLRLSPPRFGVILLTRLLGGLLLALVVAPLLVRGATAPRVALAAAGDIATISGGGVGDGGAPANAAINPSGIATDGSGNIYVADSTNCRIRKISGGAISTIAGTGVCGYGGDGGLATSAQLNFPGGVTIDAGGVIYIGDTVNCRVRKIAGGTITTVAGSGFCSYSGDAGPATAAALSSPRGVAISGGVLYIADGDNCRIRAVNAGTISTFAGSGVCGYAGDSGAASLARIGHPYALAVDTTGTLYIADSDNCRIRVVVMPSAAIATAAGNGTCAFGADGGPATSTSFNHPKGVSANAAGDVLIADSDNCRIRKLTYPTTTITTVAGNGSCGYAGDGGSATSALLRQPRGVAAAASGTNFYVSDTANCRVRSVTSGTIALLAGTGFCAYGGDGGAATNAAMAINPGGVAVDTGGNIYISDTNNCRIRKIASGVISTIAGTGVCAFGGDGGAATAATLDMPGGIALDAAGALYVADTNNCRIRKIASGVITTFGGTSVCGYNGDGTATSVQLNYPQGIAVSGTTVYVADTLNCRVRKISGGALTTIAGSGACSFSGDHGKATLAALTFPQGVAIDTFGNVYIADTVNCRIRRVTATMITTIAGTATCGLGGDGGPAASASVNQPSGVAVDASGNVYVADTADCRVRMIGGGAIITIAGVGIGGTTGCGFGGDGAAATGALLNQPRAVAVDATGAVLIADGLNARIRRITPGADADGDGVANISDNCVAVANAGQQNNDRNFIDLPASKPYDDLTRANSDTIGDACDPDDDNDGLADGAESQLGPGGASHALCPTASANTDPMKSDTDGDRVLDGAECALGSDPANAASKPANPAPGTDPDADGLSTAFEMTIGTNPGVADSDGDGVRDGVEVKGYGTDPLSANTDADGCGDGREIASVDANMTVNSTDLQQVAVAFGPSTSPGYILDFDMDKNGTINSTDLQFTATRFGGCP